MDEVVCEAVEADTLDPTALPTLLRLRIRLPKVGPLRLKKPPLLRMVKVKNKRKPNLQLKLLPPEKETISLLLEDGETHLLQRRFKRLPSLETQVGQEKENRQCRRLTRPLQLLLLLLPDHQS